VASWQHTSIMRFILFCLLVSVALVAAADEAAPSSSHVKTLTSADFDASVKTGTWLVEFFAPWCGHCKKLAPTWEELATAAKKDGKFGVASVDCTIEKDLASRFGVRGFPTIKLIHGGKVYSYKGQRTLADFTAFAAGGYATSTEVTDYPAAGEAPKAAPTEAPKAEPAKVPTEPVKAASGDAAAAASDVVVLTDKTFKETIATGPWLVKFYAPWCGHCKKLAPTWDELAAVQKTAKKFNVAKVDCTVEKTTCQEQGVGGYPTLKLFNNGQLVAPYDQARTLQAFQDWVDKKLSVKQEL